MPFLNLKTLTHKTREFKFEFKMKNNTWIKVCGKILSYSHKNYG